MQPSTRYIWALAIVTHLVFFGSIFDIYYRSPLVTGIQKQHRPSDLLKESHRALSLNDTGFAPASRLVLFVADGLRAESFYHSENSPFLKNICKSGGVCGVSHTRVPTESRPGHVALIAGFYEDVSAVTRGWQENPVEFDSVFNQSTETWSWGSPDILPMFVKGASGNHIHTSMYSVAQEDFSKSNASELDTWVFDRVTTFLESAKLNSTLAERISQPGVIFFLHLLGLDTMGHSRKPKSRNYASGIRIVDEGVRRISTMVNDFFHNDDRTAFIFTADHGMTDWGSHGAGLRHETETPFVAWGAGIKKTAQMDSIPELNDINRAKTNLKPWTFRASKFINLEQADTAALMSALLDLNYPKHSVGILPYYILDSSQEYTVSALTGNWLGATAQLQASAISKATLASLPITKGHYLSQLFDGPIIEHLRSRIRSNLGLNHESAVQSLAQEIDALMSDFNLEQSTVQAILHEYLLPLTLDGLTHYHSLERPLLSLIITAGYLCWIGFIWVVGSAATRPDDTDLPNWRCRVSKRDIGFVLAVAGFCWLVGLQYTTVVYAFIPYFLVVNLRRVISAHQGTLDISAVGFICLLLKCYLAAVYLVGVFFYRWLLSVGLVGAAIMIMVQHFTASRKTSLVIAISLTTSCCVSAIFPLLPTIGGTLQTSFILVTSVVIGCVCFAQCVLPTRFQLSNVFLTDPGFNKSGTKSFTKLIASFNLLTVFLGSLFVVAGVSHWVTHWKSGSKNGTNIRGNTTLNSTESNFYRSYLNLMLAYIIYGLNWSLLLLSIAIPYIYRRNNLTRSTKDSTYSVPKISNLLQSVTIIYLSFYTPYILLGTSYEVLFYPVYAWLLVSWILYNVSISRPELCNLNPNLHIKIEQPSSQYLPVDATNLHDSSLRRRPISNVDQPSAEPYTDGNVSAGYLSPGSNHAGDQFWLSFSVIFLSFLAFFGTGNIASINSFNPSAILSFAAVFRPFLMATLLMLKVVIPMFLCAVAFKAVLLMKQYTVQPIRLLSTIAILSDLMALNFFFMLRADGSWLDIGTSISHYVISMGTSLFMMILTACAGIYLFDL